MRMMSVIVMAMVMMIVMRIKMRMTIVMTMRIALTLVTVMMMELLPEAKASLIAFSLSLIKAFGSTFLEPPISRAAPIL